MSPPFPAGRYFAKGHANPGAGGNLRYPNLNFGVKNVNAGTGRGQGFSKGRFEATWPDFTQIRVISAGGEACNFNHYGTMTDFAWGTCGAINRGTATRLVNEGGGGNPDGLKYAPRAVQFHPHGGQFDLVWLSARTPRKIPTRNILPLFS